jgi:hypothetical protein
MQIDSLELIGYDPEMDIFPSTVYSNLSPAPLPYKWDVKGRHGDDRRGVRAPGRDLGFLARGQHVLGRRASQPGADETVNVPYDIGGHRVGFVNSVGLQETRDLQLEPEFGTPQGRSRHAPLENCC